MRGRFAVVGFLVTIAMFAVACAQTDAGLTSKVKAKLTADDTVKAYKIDVDTKEGVVTLNGAVDNEAAHAQAIQLARSTEGVKDVVDNLRVDPGAAATTGTSPPMTKEPLPPGSEASRAVGEGRTDITITAEVKSKLLSADEVSGLKIDVDTSDGVVTLTGNVKNAAEKRTALELARGVEGVKRVEDKLTIERK